MRSVFGIVLVVGLGLAGFAVYMVKGYFDQQQIATASALAAAAEKVNTVEVLAVKEDAPYGKTLTAEDVMVIQYAEPFLPEGVFRTMEELFPANEEAQRTVLRQMDAKEAILATKVTEPGGNAGITSLLKPGMRAFAISVDVASGVSGFLRPGDRVDVYWTGSAQMAGNMGETEFTKLIESGMQIVAIDQTTDNNLNEATVARTITVEATPQQVAGLAQAQSTGDLSLSLVGAFDETVAEAVEVDQNKLLGIQAAPEPVAQPAPEPVAEEKVCTIRTRRGADVVEIPIPCTN